MKAISASVKQLESKMGPLRNDNRLLQNTIGKFMITYGEQEIVVGKRVRKLAGKRVRKLVEKRVRKLVKSVATRFIGILICISRAMLNWCLREISKLYYLAIICVGIGLDILSKVSGVVLTLVMGRLRVHWIHSQWWVLISTNGHSHVKLR